MYVKKERVFITLFITDPRIRIMKWVNNKIGRG
jgi:hypothetical protein